MKVKKVLRYILEKTIPTLISFNLQTFSKYTKNIGRINNGEPIEQLFGYEPLYEDRRWM